MRFDDIVTVHLGWIARQAVTFCREKADADDLAQETLLRILSNRDKFDCSRDFKPWALTIMTNLYKSWYTRKSRAPFADVDSDTCEYPTSASSDSRMQFRDVLAAIKKAAGMSIGVECVVLYAKGYSYEEIAQMVGITVGTVKSRIAAGRKVVKSLLP